MAEKSYSESSVRKADEKKTVLIIEGILENGSTFRPRDWPERIPSTFAEFGKDHRLHYAPTVCPRIHNGQKVLAVDSSLQVVNSTMFQMVMKLARENRLRIREEYDPMK
jgi:hypothetical protein